MRTWMAVVCLLAVSPGVAGAAVSSGSQSSIEGMVWLAGHWIGSTGGVDTEEHWTDPAGGALIGMHKDVKNGKMISFEFLRIIARTDGIYYMASPIGREATPFKLVEQSAGRLVFENPAHDFPNRILYWSDEPGVLHARVEGKEEGVAKSLEWRWERAKP